MSADSITGALMTGDTHLGMAELLRALDGELAPAEVDAVEHHLDTCGACRAKLREVGAACAAIDETLLRAAPPAAADARARSRLAQDLQARENGGATNGSFSVWPLHSRLWSSGIAAAALAGGLALVLASSHVTIAPSTPGLSNSMLQVNGETFVALPYSNRDLAEGAAPRIVEMQLPASQLVNAGVVFEAVSSAASDPDQTVRADVLLGADGEPLGVHVLSQ